MLTRGIIRFTPSILSIVTITSMATTCLPTPKDATLVDLNNNMTVLKSDKIWSNKPQLILVVRRPG